MKILFIFLLGTFSLNWACKTSSAHNGTYRQGSFSPGLSLLDIEFYDGAKFLNDEVLGNSYRYKFGESTYQKLVYTHYKKPFQTYLIESGNYEVEKFSLTFEPKIKMLCRIDSLVENMDCDLNGDYLNGYYVNSDTLNDQKIQELGFLPRKTEILFEDKIMVFTDPLGLIRYQEIVR